MNTISDLEKSSIDRYTCIKCSTLFEKWQSKLALLPWDFGPLPRFQHTSPITIDICQLMCSDPTFGVVWCALSVDLWIWSCLRVVLNLVRTNFLLGSLCSQANCGWERESIERFKGNYMCAIFYFFCLNWFHDLTFNFNFQSHQYGFNLIISYIPYDANWPCNFYEH